MKTFARTLQFAAWLTAFSFLLPLTTAGADAPAADPSPDMIRELRASGPHPSLGVPTAALGRLVGGWDVEYAFFSKDGKTTRETGRYLAGWVMDGRAVQDVWMVNASKTRKEQEIYTSVFYPNTKSGAWDASWLDPEHAILANFTGDVAGDNRIVMETHDFGGNIDRWSFNDIGPDSLVFHDDISSDGGKTWWLAEEDRFTRSSAAATGSMADMIGALQAAGPHASLGDEAKVFDRLAGTWDGEYNEFSKDGKTTRSSGEWTFGWVTDGRAMQDLFIIHPSKQGDERYIGTTLRYFDPKSRTWSVTFIDPENDVAETLKGGAVGDDRIVLSSQDASGKQRRWSLVDIGPDSWVFRDEVSRDDGKTWRLLEEDRMTRRGAARGAL